MNVSSSLRIVTHRLLGFLALILCSSSLSAQNTISLVEYLNQVQASTSKEFFYKTEWVDSIKVDATQNGDLMITLGEAIKSSGFELFTYQENYVFIYPNKFELEKLRLKEENSRRGYNFKEYIRIGNPTETSSSDRFILSGRVLDELGEPIHGVTIVVEETSQGAQTNANGQYSVELVPGNYEIQYQFVGLQAEKRRITLYSSGALDVSLFPHVRFLEEVIVEENSPEKILDQNVIGRTTLGLNTLETMPAFFGETDVLKSTTMLPGVNTSGESSAYLNVRGGRNDQTLILMNKAPIFSPGHLLGFFSVFNGDFVSGASLYKGNIPSRYGTRASSVLDVNMNRQATKKVNYYGGLGIVNTNLGVKTKLLDNRLDLHVGGRTTYSDWLFRAVPNQDFFNSSARFGDANMVSKFKLNENNTFHSSLFFSRDYFRYANEILYKWNTLSGSMEWNHLFKNNMLWTSLFTYSRLKNDSEGLLPTDEFLLESSITNYALKNSLSLDIGKGELDVGVDVSKYDLNPGEIEPTAVSSFVEPERLDEEDLLDLGVYVDYTLDLTDNISLNPGVRVAHFVNVGAGVQNTYLLNAPLEPENVTGQRFFGDGETMATYTRLEPRLGVNFKWNNRSVKLGYTRTNQFLHLISNTALINPVSIWKGSDEFIQPTQIDQYSAGYVQNVLDNKVSITVEGYYKQMSNLIDYKDGAELVLNENLEQVIIGGEGEAYGVEFLVSKTSGLLKGWASYTYSRAFITTNGDDATETINNGERYPYYSDRPHNFQFYMDYKVTKKWTISSNFTYTTGAPTSAPRNIYQIDGINVPYFPTRNSERIPDYHRLDLAITLKSRIRKTKKNNDRWVLSFYNVYSRSNASTIFFRRQGDNRPARPFQLISIGQIIPTITYKFEF